MDLCKYILILKNNLISSSIVASAIKSSSKTLSDSDATNRAIIEPLIQKYLQESLNNKYNDEVVYINKITINNTDFEDSYNAAIAAKQQAQLQAEQQAIENERAINKAKADATVIQTNAEAEAAAKIIKAEAEAKANKLLEDSLTEKILREMYIDKWNGILPSVVASETCFTIDTKHKN